jgi:hypothetical protein
MYANDQLFVEDYPEIDNSGTTILPLTEGHI